MITGMNELFSLGNRVAIVTGASTGLGQAICVGYAEAGARVVGVSRSSMAETRQLVEAVGGSFLAVQADLMSCQPIELIIRESLAAYGRIDILVNNAGITRRENAIDLTEADWDDVLSVDAKSVYFLAQAVAKQFIRQGGGGKIINIASMLSYQGGIRVPAYTAAKHAVKGMTMAMANEWAPYQINVNAIAPGYMATHMTEPIRVDTQRSADILSRIPAGRWGTPDDLVGASIFLAAKASDYIHGFTLAVDGGWLAR
ncbi:MAG: 2-dehydro-3-deoxy-D-gluconate 5-dehydrogenase KduD [Clostridia bacterium]|nr:2-dehydro-3-deoxy-D-gluconate 5-dehydrogenase KduD [Clostridia bacterium]